MRYVRSASFVFILMLFFVELAYAAITGVISGTITDTTGAVVPGVTVTALNEETGVRLTVVTDNRGFYSFPVLDVGRYTISTAQPGFDAYQATGIKVDANSSIRRDIILKVGNVAVVEEVTSNPVQVETQSTQLGEVIESQRITAVPLNGRAFTDLLALQPGVSPYSNTESADTPSPSGGLNGGNVSINGGRGASNGYMVNGGNVNDGVENSTAIVPNLDSLSEFRIITSNFDAEYGNFSGGQVNVVTKNGTNQWHGSAFEFLRDTVFNARPYSFSSPAPPRGSYRQNIYGGTFGGPIKKDKMFFFADFQGTNQRIGTTNSVTLPSAANLKGDVSDWTPLLTNFGGSVQGAGWAGVLSQRLGYTVTDQEPYFGDNACTPTSMDDPCVFPNAVIPKAAWSSAVTPLMKYIPTPNSTVVNSGTSSGIAPAYVTTAKNNTVDDYKEALRVDMNTRFGTFFGYYFMDNATIGNPYGGGNDGLFPTATQQRAQMSNLGLTTTFKNNAVNTFRFTYVRSAAHIGNPSYQTPGPTLASLGFVTPWGPAGGIGNINPSLAGVPNISISEGGTFGTPLSTQGRYVNTFQWLDNFMKVIGTHTVQFGVNYHYDQINERNAYAVNGSFNFPDGNETGLGFADFLLGAEDGGFTQASAQILDSRSHYAAGYVQDAWRARSDLTLNYGLRYEVTTPWYDTQNKIQTIVPGQQSQVFPGAPLGWVFPGDKGIPRTLAPIHWNKFAPRFGFAYSPTTQPSGLLSKITGGPGMFSLRGGYGVFYTNFQDESGFVVIGDAPFGLYYQAPVPTMLESPYIDRATQNIELQKFPFSFPPTNVSIKNPDNNVPWDNYLPLSSSYAVGVHNTVPYIQNYFLGIQRGIGRNTVVTATYVGNQGRHLANQVEANPGNPALCLSLNQAALAPGETPCGPRLESNSYTLKNGTVVPGTRPLGLAFGSNPYLLTQATSNFNSLQTNLKHSSTMWDVMVAYTFGRSFDNSSAMTDATNPINPRASYALSSYNVTHSLVASYNVQLPFARWTDNRFGKALLGGWSISGITKMASGQPITLSDNSDYSLTGSSGVDKPFYTPGNLFAGGLHGDRNPRDINPATGKHYPFFNTSLFTSEKNMKLGFGVVGNTHRRFFAGPGLNHTDLALLRDFHIHESHVLQFRAEAFNIANHAEFSNPSGSINSGNFGIVTTGINPRILQMAVKYHF
ncbi:TonB-dependent receptor [Edaphobacter flagellatus]|uniref:TonB-dependent receptor n=1 Tax=Edaphobacter flagellatus TaxID=1933044 RepID=UPI0021B1834F|nr:carboxypeptidase regulatory-like domain-containing protein [Edaphobacter flagellatus]